MPGDSASRPAMIHALNSALEGFSHWETTRAMILAGLFAGVLFLGLILGDWLYFVRSDSGCRTVRLRDWAQQPDRFSLQSLMRLADLRRCGAAP